MSSNASLITDVGIPYWRIIDFDGRSIIPAIEPDRATVELSYNMNGGSDRLTIALPNAAVEDWDEMVPEVTLHRIEVERLRDALTAWLERAR